MDELLTRVLDAHGGMTNWSKVRTATAKLSLGGPFWEWKGWPNIYQRQTVTFDPHREHISFTPFTGTDNVSVLNVPPDCIEIRSRAGDLIESRTKPRESFPVYANDTAWDALQVAYFTSAATWNYLTAPFVFTHPGVDAHEIEPWQEDGQTWRRLKVTFPESIANHNREQVFYYDHDFYQRRMDYQPDVTGTPIAHYTHNPQYFDGFLFYTLRLVHLRAADNVADRDFAPITIDIESVSFTRG